MKVLYDHDPVGDPRGAAVTIGVFDGVHRGHQSVLRQLVDDASRRELMSTVVTFDPHPALVLAPEKAPAQIEPLERRLERFAALGIDQVRVITFDALASREEAEAFVDRVLVDQLATRHVHVGRDFHFGRDRGGNVERLEAWGRTRGFDVAGLELVTDGGRISTTRIRDLIAQGRVDEAGDLLGHAVVITGTVEHGDARGGAELGYPTANLALPTHAARPGLGIYAGAAQLASGAWHAAAISVGRRPQFYEHGDVLIEAFLLDFDGNLYGQDVDLVFFKFLRGEATFNSVDELVEQIERDVAHAAKEYEHFAGNPSALLQFYV